MEALVVDLISHSKLTYLQPACKSSEHETPEAITTPLNHSMMSRKTGVVFIEARIKDDAVNDPDIDCISYEKLQADLENQLSSENLTFELLEDILDDPRNAELKLGPFYQYARDTLHSLKVVEYMGPITDINCYTTDNVNVEVQVYTLYNTLRSLDENQELPQAEITPLPHVRFADQWDELVFQDDIKGDLIWMMMNIPVKFSRLHKQGEISPLILLYGPPGTGKTTLCQGLAQKISIRLNTTYNQTRLVQIKTATLLSKYYSESARKVDEIFNKIARMCQEDSEEFVCVLIDEVESIASSREFSTKNGESQDSLRATNALLTGLDRTKTYPNVIFLCTSNMLEALDAAFLDRCGLKRSINPPSMVSQYEILRSRIQKLIKRKVIKVTESNETIPGYNDAVLASTAGNTHHPGCQLLNAVQIIRTSNAHAISGKEISGRSLTQLPEQAILKYLRSDECDLKMAMSFITKLILSEQGQGGVVVERQDRINHRNSGKKRKFRLTIEDYCNFDTGEKIKNAIRSQPLSASHKLQIEEWDSC
ncbi:hypothetical protein K3495_g14209 [Podosphaera aphanis]|nr:hypothetical protein K3495_g14209 [Podosphaera aphanis]